MTHVFGGNAGAWTGTLTYETDPPPPGFPVGLHLPPYDPAIGFDIVGLDPYHPDRVWESPDNLPFFVSVTDSDTRDVLSVSSSSSGSPGGATYWVMSLVDTTGTVFSDDSLPLSLSFDHFDSIGFAYSLIVGDRRSDVVGRIDWLYTVPEPDTALLLAAGLVALGVHSAATRRAR